MAALIGRQHWTSIPGATASTYTLQVADEGSRVRMLVTASNPDGTVSAPSASSATVQASQPVTTGAPTVTGTAQNGYTLTGTQGAWNGIGNTYANQWQRSTNGTSWTDIAGASDSSYALQVADAGMKVRLRVTASNPDGQASATEPASQVATASPPVNTAAPAISGTAVRSSMLTATSGSWIGQPTGFAYQWQSSTNGTSWTDIVGATAAGYTLGTGDEHTMVRVLVSATNPDGTTVARSAATASVQAAPPANTVAPSVSGTAQRSFTLSASQGTWAGLGNTYAYQWQRSSDGSTWGDVAGASSSTYVLDATDEAARLRVVVTAGNPDGTAVAQSAASAVVQAAAPVNTALPVVTGTAQRSSTLTVSQGTWSGIGNTYAYQWQHASDGTHFTDIAGATGASYTLSVSDEGTSLRARVTASNPDATITVASAQTTIVQGAPPASTSAPQITGLAQRTFTLSASQGAWSGIGNTYAYQWQQSSDGFSWSDVPGATSSTYVLGVADERTTLRAIVTASNPDGSLSIASAPSSTVQGAPPFTTAAPQIAGTAARAQTLSIASPGNWFGLGNTYSYQWQRSRNGSWSSIAGATDTSYLLATADEGSQIRVAVTASNPDGTQSAVSNSSAAVLAAPPQPTSVPQLTGAAQRGGTLSASQGTWTGAGNTYAYQWQRSSSSGYSDVAGATGATYPLSASDETKQLRVLVSATNPDGTVRAQSAPSAVVQGTPPVLTSLPMISGTPRVGATMTATSGNWTPGDATFSYQWQHSADGASWSTIQGANAASYPISQADYASRIRVLVSATNIDGSQSAASAASPAITQPPVNLAAPAAPTGTLLDTYALRADPGSWDTLTASFSYSWMRCPADATVVSSDCTVIGHGPTYTLTVSDIGHPIAVSVTAISSGGTSVPVASALTNLVSGRPLTNLAPPAINGTPQVPQRLTAKAGTWSVSPTSDSFTWLRCAADGSTGCTQVATGPSYTLSGGDRAHTIVLEEDVASPGRTAGAQSAALTVVDQPLPQATVAPTVSGTAQRTFTLTATTGTWTNGPTLSYQWLQCNPDGSRCQPVPDATGLSYLLSKADEGFTYALQVSATNTSGTTVAQTKLSAEVAALLPVATHAPQITGATVQQGILLGVAGDAWRTTSDTTYADQWQRCNAGGTGCVAIAGATNGLYTPVLADVGHALIATVTATNADGPVTAATAPSAVVLPAAPRWKTLPLISADPGGIGDLLTITPGTFSGPAVTGDVSEMMRCTNTCTPVGDPNAAGYQIAAGDLGAILRVRETASNSGGATIVWSARYVGPVTSVDAGAAVLAVGVKALRNANGQALATAQLASVSGARSFATMTPQRVLKLRRAAGVSGKLRVWACQLTGTAAGAPGGCSAQVALRTAATVRIPASMKGRLRIVVVRRGH